MEVIMELHHSLLQHHIQLQNKLVDRRTEIILFGMDIPEKVVDLVVQSMDLVDIHHTQVHRQVIPAVVGVVVLNMVEMDLQLAEIIDKPHSMVLRNHKVQMEQIMDMMVVMEQEETMLEVVEEVLDKMEVMHQPLVVMVLEVMV